MTSKIDSLNGEIIFKEIYGSSRKEIVYVKHSDTQDVVALKYHQRDLGTLLKNVFLPQGYPKSVSNDYVAYQIWDTAQAFCSTITGTLATQEVLRGVGVGSTNATPLSATITWVVKDGCGHIGRILFAYSHGSYLDAYSKTWRLYADTLNDAAMCIEIALPLFPNYITVVLCISTVMKAIVGVAGGATRAAMTQHHSLRGNMADVSAKDSAQETAVNLVASIVALFIISSFGNSLVIFTLMLVLHIVFNYLAVRAVCLRTLNAPRLLLLVDLYLQREATAGPCAINAQEPIVYCQRGAHDSDQRLCGFQIKLASSLSKLAKSYPKAIHLNTIRETYADNKYLIFPSTRDRTMYVMFKENAHTDDILCAYFHAVILSVFVCAINDVPLPVYLTERTRPFARVCESVQGAEWSRQPALGGGLTHEPSPQLLAYSNKIAAAEWPLLREALLKTGWELNKHLLIVDEWRVQDGRRVSKHTTTATVAPEMLPHDPALPPKVPEMTPHAPAPAQPTEQDSRANDKKLHPFQDIDTASNLSFSSTTIEPDQSSRVSSESIDALNKKLV